MPDPLRGLIKPVEHPRSLIQKTPPTKWVHRSAGAGFFNPTDKLCAFGLNQQPDDCKATQNGEEKTGRGTTGHLFAVICTAQPRRIALESVLSRLVLGQPAASQMPPRRAVETTFGAVLIGKSRECLEVPAGSSSERADSIAAGRENSMESICQSKSRSLTYSLARACQRPLRLKTDAKETSS